MFRAFTYRKSLLFFATWWIVWIGVEWYIISFYGVPKGRAFGDTALNILLLILSSLAVFNTIKFYRPTRGNLLYVRIWALLHAWFITALNAWVVVSLSHHNPDVITFVSQSWPVRYMFNLIQLGITTAAVVFYFYVLEEKAKEQRKDDAEKLAKETELIKLRQQLQPHFLFNSLNSISALAGSKPEQARKMIQQLSDFLRGTLRKDESHLVTLREELHHLQLYLEIEKVRFGHRLNTHIDSINDLQNLMLPSLLLQPLVENAIKFGLYDTTERVMIELHTSHENSELIITVKNPFDPSTAAPRKGTGFGLSSVNRRLYLLYGRTDLLKTRFDQTHFLATIHIPQA